LPPTSQFQFHSLGIKEQRNRTVGAPSEVVVGFLSTAIWPWVAASTALPTSAFCAPSS